VIRTKSLAEAAASDDGDRILITRYRPRAVARGAESWHAWDKRLAPSVALLDLAFGKVRESGRVIVRDAEPLAWAEFEARFRQELRQPDAAAALAELRQRSAAGETVTLLCYCADERRCHRGIVRAVLAAAR
jgi:uncharacterized protein YeaO (DUF488 family)